MLPFDRCLVVSTVNLFQLRVTAAEPGRVDFELDIRKEHTVSAVAPVKLEYHLYETAESSKYHSWRHNC